MLHTAEADVESDGSWGDFPAENPERAAIQNRGQPGELIFHKTESTDMTGALVETVGQLCMLNHPMMLNAARRDL